MVALLLWKCVVRKIAIIEDELCIVDIEKIVLLWRYILQMGGLSIWQGLVKDRCKKQALNYYMVFKNKQTSDFYKKEFFIFYYLLN